MENYKKYLPIFNAIENAKKCYQNILPYNLVAELHLPDALILQQISYWTPHMKVKRDGYLWAAKPIIRWVLECGTPRSTVRRSLRRLKEKGLIDTKNYLYGYLRQNHVRIIWENFLPKYFEASLFLMDNIYLSEMTTMGIPNWSEWSDDIIINYKENLLENKKAVVPTAPKYFIQREDIEVIIEEINRVINGSIKKSKGSIMDAFDNSEGGIIDNVDSIMNSPDYHEGNFLDDEDSIMNASDYY